MRTARSLTSGEYLFDVFIAPSSQSMEPPVNPGRFSASEELPATTCPARGVGSGFDSIDESLSSGKHDINKIAEKSTEIKPSRFMVDFPKY